MPKPKPPTTPSDLPVTVVALADLTPYPKNPRHITPAAVNAVAESLAAFGWQQPIVIDPKKVIVAGHTRRQAALQLGWTHAPTVTIAAKHARAYRLADNRSGEFSTWDLDVLPGELAALPTGQLEALPALDFDAIVQPPVEGQTDPDDIPEAPEPRTKRGDVWTLGDHRLMCGQSETDFAGFASDVEHGLVLTDPPYGINVVNVKTGTVRRSNPDKTKGSIGRAKPPSLRGQVGKPGVVGPRLYQPIIGDDRPFDPTWLLALGSAQVIFGAQHFASALVDGRAWLVWDKGIGDHTTFSQAELAWTSFAGRTRMYRHTWSGMVREGDRRTELADRVHPTQKPVGLMKQILDDIGTGYDVVLDPYLGSGSTLIACEILKRRCYAMEISPEYCDVAVARWEAFTGRTATR